MKDRFRRSGASGNWLCRALRVFVSVVLVAAMGMEILPSGIAECAPAVPGGEPGRTFCIEPLQVCDHGDSFVGVLFDLPVLLPGAPCLLPSTETLRLALQAAAFVPDGFHPAIDHPPQLSA
jgi:hypothetical protein